MTAFQWGTAVQRTFSYLSSNLLSFILLGSICSLGRRFKQSKLEILKAEEVRHRFRWFSKSQPNQHPWSIAGHDHQNDVLYLRLNGFVISPCPPAVTFRSDSFISYQVTSYPNLQEFDRISRYSPKSTNDYRIRPTPQLELQPPRTSHWYPSSPPLRHTLQHLHLLRPPQWKTPSFHTCQMKNFAHRGHERSSPGGMQSSVS